MGVYPFLFVSVCGRVKLGTSRVALRTQGALKSACPAPPTPGSSQVSYFVLSNPYCVYLTQIPILGCITDLRLPESLSTREEQAHCYAQTLEQGTAQGAPDTVTVGCCDADYFHKHSVKPSCCRLSPLSSAGFSPPLMSGVTALAADFRPALCPPARPGRSRALVPFIFSYKHSEILVEGGLGWRRAGSVGQ